ncbi:hypothetical protein A2U01_0088758, partial [Trifolium medium]|nr:hypothetical protein [Trifolium medium]
MSAVAGTFGYIAP